jgi:transcription termination factor NusB
LSLEYKVYLSLDNLQVPVTFHSSATTSHRMKLRHCFIYLLIELIWIEFTLSSLGVPQAGPWHNSFGNFFHQLSGSIINTYRDISDELKYRKLSLYQYREQINTKVQASIEKFRKERLEETSTVLQDLNNRINQLQDLYKDSIASFEKQKSEILKFNEAYELYTEVRRRSPLDDSLESFRKAYNETFENILRSPLATGLGIDKIMKSIDEITHHSPATPGHGFDLSGILEDTTDLFNNVLKKKEIYDNKLQQQLQGSWETILRSALEGSRAAEMNAQPVINELMRLQDDFSNSIKTITNSTQSSIMNQIMKSGIRNESRLLETRLRRLESELSSSAVGQAIETQRKQVESLVRTLQDRIRLTNSTYDGLISKRRNTMYQSYLNDATLNKVLKLIDPSDKGRSS